MTCRIVGNKSIADVCGMSITDVLAFIDGLVLSESEKIIASRIYKELKASLDPEYAKEYAAQKAELAEKRARQEAEMAEREAKQANRKESRTAKKAEKNPETKAFEQCSDEDYADIEDID